MAPRLLVMRVTASRTPRACASAARSRARRRARTCRATRGREAGAHGLPALAGAQGDADGAGARRTARTCGTGWRARELSARARTDWRLAARWLARRAATPARCARTAGAARIARRLRQLHMRTGGRHRRRRRRRRGERGGEGRQATGHQRGFESLCLHEILLVQPVRMVTISICATTVSRSSPPFNCSAVSGPPRRRSNQRAEHKAEHGQDDQDRQHHPGRNPEQLRQASAPAGRRPAR